MFTEKYLEQKNNREIQKNGFPRGTLKILCTVIENVILATNFSTLWDKIVLPKNAISAATYFLNADTKDFFETLFSLYLNWRYPSHIFIVPEKLKKVWHEN